jgi:hypothetical protein
MKFSRGGVPAARLSPSPKIMAKPAGGDARPTEDRISDFRFEIADLKTIADTKFRWKMEDGRGRRSEVFT